MYACHTPVSVLYIIAINTILQSLFYTLLPYIPYSSQCFIHNCQINHTSVIVLYTIAINTILQSLFYTLLPYIPYSSHCFIHYCHIYHTPISVLYINAIYIYHNSVIVLYIITIYTILQTLFYTLLPHTCIPYSLNGFIHYCNIYHTPVIVIHKCHTNHSTVSVCIQYCQIFQTPLNV